MLAALFQRRVKSSQATATACYNAQKTLLTPTERSFYHALDMLRPGGVQIAPKVQLQALLTVKPGTTWSERQHALDRLRSEHVDFVLINEHDTRPLLVIELDGDQQASAGDGDERSAFIDVALANAGIPILHVHAQSTYEPEQLHRQIARVIQAHFPTVHH